MEMKEKTEAIESNVSMASLQSKGLPNSGLFLYLIVHIYIFCQKDNRHISLNFQRFL